MEVKAEEKANNIMKQKFEESTVLRTETKNNFTKRVKEKNN